MLSFGAAALSAFVLGAGLVQADGPVHTPRVLVFTGTTGFRHDSIPTAIEVLGQNADRFGIAFNFTEDKGAFNDGYLSLFDILDQAGQDAFHRYIQNGGHYMGVHCAATALTNSTMFRQTQGGIFDYHPSFQNATFLRLDDNHPSTVNLPDQWRYPEEVYYFNNDPRNEKAVVYLTVNQSSYNNDGGDGGPNQGNPHPIAWGIESPWSAVPLSPGAAGAGRTFYTGLGHANETWHDEIFIGHIFGGLSWVLDGATTKAYGVGLVGSTDLPPKPKPVPVAAPDVNATNAPAAPSVSTSPSASAKPSGSSLSTPLASALVLGAALVGALACAL
ncbi:uncharacterized protein LOC62_04G005793 [Vanrija pseudolonga]|uniref:ThuA-like domain-containing protein n=1 Tax=Vanrija pseudolonga TaxID=143232 RepID=A0AAF0YEH3_9TREE|nr:hypothetical protein LOC62_04G005793 [Vanrija pseudolonga]